VTLWLKARIKESIKATIARQLHSKHMTAAMNKHATEELLEVMCSMQSTLRLYNDATSQVNSQSEVEGWDFEVGS
jgi:molybdopterin-guanine dinucleotide biosynthesis protein